MRRHLVCATSQLNPSFLFFLVVKCTKFNLPSRKTLGKNGSVAQGSLFIFGIFVKFFLLCDLWFAFPYPLPDSLSCQSNPTGISFLLPPVPFIYFFLGLTIHSLVRYLCTYCQNMDLIIFISNLLLFTFLPKREGDRFQTNPESAPPEYYPLFPLGNWATWEHFKDHELYIYLYIMTNAHLCFLKIYLKCLEAERKIFFGKTVAGKNYQWKKNKALNLLLLLICQFSSCLLACLDSREIYH